MEIVSIFCKVCNTNVENLELRSVVRHFSTHFLEYINPKVERVKNFVYNHKYAIIGLVPSGILLLKLVK